MSNSEPPLSGPKSTRGTGTTSTDVSGAVAPTTGPQGHTTEPPAESTGTRSSASSKNHRAQQTRAELCAAVETLILEGRPAISVSDVVRTAGVSRSSFYLHYEGVEDLTRDYLRIQINAAGLLELGSTLPADCTPAVTARTIFSGIVAHLVEHFPLYTVVADQPMARRAYDSVVRASIARLLTAVTARATVPADVSEDLTVRFLAGGAATLIVDWLGEKIDVSDDDLVTGLVALLPPWLGESP